MSDLEQQQASCAKLKQACRSARATLVNGMESTVPNAVYDAETATCNALAKLLYEIESWEIHLRICQHEENKWRAVDGLKVGCKVRLLYGRAWPSGFRGITIKRDGHGEVTAEATDEHGVASAIRLIESGMWEIVSIGGGE